MALTVVLAALTGLSALLLLWQLIVALRFPLHRKIAEPQFLPPVTLLKPLKGADTFTSDCLRSWFEQDYPAPVQLLFGVAAADDPACSIVRELIAQFPNVEAELIVAPEFVGPNAKVATLAQLQRHARHEFICVSDADVRVSSDFLQNAVAPLRDEAVGLVNCFYRLANPETLAMKIESIAINADFWSQVLQSNSLKRQDFALGAVMITTRRHLEAIGGFAALANHLADDFQLGRRIAASGARIELCPVVVECWERSVGWRDVWKHQVRWARTIRVSAPISYLFSILNNTTLWAVLLILFGTSGVLPLFAITDSGKPFLPWLTDRSSEHYVVYAGYDVTWLLGLFVIMLRLTITTRLLRRFSPVNYRDVSWLAPVKDLFQAAVWVAAFTGNRVEWRGRTFRVQRGGTLTEISPRQ